MKGLLVTTDLEIKEIEFNDILKTNELVGGYPECVAPRFGMKGIGFVCDEDGSLKDKDINVVASVIYNGSYTDNPRLFSPIVGDVIFYRYGASKHEAIDFGDEYRILKLQIETLIKSYKALTKEGSNES